MIADSWHRAREREGESEREREGVGLVDDTGTPVQVQAASHLRQFIKCDLFTIAS